MYSLRNNSQTDESFEFLFSEPKLSLFQKFKLALVGYSPIGVYRNSEDGEQRKIFVAKCRVHGLYADVPHGSLQELRCQKCEQVFLFQKLD